MTPEYFSQIGAALYGTHWRLPLAEALEVAERTVRRWEHGDNAIPDGIADDLAALCRKHSVTLDTIAEQLSPDESTEGDPT